MTWLPSETAADRPTLDQCQCSLRTKLVGDGCEHCNPELARELRELPPPPESEK